MRIGVPASSATVSWTPLALTLGLHLLLVLAWLLRPGTPFVMPAALEREIVLVMVAPPARPAPLPRPVSRPARAAKELTSQPISQPTSQPITAPALPQPAPQEPPADAATEAPVESELVQGDASASGDLLATSRAMAGRVDRELRKGGSPITAEPDRKWERFASMVASARKSDGMSGTVEQYTADDGITIYRKTVGNRVACYRGGSVGGISTADGRTAGNIRCPPGVRWTRL